MLEKRTEYYHTIYPDGQIQVKRDDQIWENGTMISHVYHRHVVFPGADLAEEDDRCKIIAGAIYTPSIINAYREAERLRQIQ